MRGPLPAVAEQIEHWPIDRLKPYERNARTHSREQIEKIAASMTEFGFTNPILVDGQDGIIAGHGRIEAAKLLGLETVPVVVLDHLSDAQRRAYILADNRLALDAGWDEELLAAEFADLLADDFDLALTGFSDDEIEDLLPEFDDEPVADGAADEDAVPEPELVPVSRKGDLWRLGRHRLLCGDSTVITDVERLMGGGRAALIVTDPPYNVAYQGKTAEALTIANDAMDGESFYRFLLDAYASMYAVAEDGAAIYVFHADTEGVNFRRALVDAGFKLAQCCVWVKQTFVLGRQDYHWKHEPVLYGWKPTAAHNWYSDRRQTTVWHFDRPSRNADHPTMKPVDLIEYPITNSSKRGDVVLDLFGGSGSTLIACEKTGRVARLMELDPRYVDVIIRRWQEYTGKVARLDDTGETFAEVEARRDGSAVPIRPGGLMTAGRPFTESPAANDDLSSEGQVA